MNKPKLSDRQLKAIPFIVASPTYTQGLNKAEVNRTTFYKWLKQPEFKAELDRQREQIAQEAIAVLAQSVTKAVETLTGLLSTQDERLKRLVCNDIIGHIMRCQENRELAERLDAIEERLSDQGGRA